MPLFTKEQLLNKDEVELRSIAESMDTPHKSSSEKNDLIYDILDAQAELSAEQQASQPAKKRTRIVKKDVDHIYSASKGQSERFEKAESTEQSSGDDTKDVVPEPPKRKRGRPSKAEIAAREAQENNTVSEEDTEIAEPETAVPEEMVAEAEADELQQTVEVKKSSFDEDLPDFLNEQIKNSNVENVAESEMPSAEELAKSIVGKMQSPQLSEPKNEEFAEEIALIEQNK